MVTRPFTQGLSWLHSRVGRRIPVKRISLRNPRTTNSRTRVMPSAPAALHPTVYLPSVADTKLVA